MKYAKYEYGTAVAFVEANAIYFGVIEEISYRVNKQGETLDYLISHQDGTIWRNEEEIADIDEGSAFSTFDKMVHRHPARQWAMNESAQLAASKPDQAGAPLVTDGVVPAAVQPTAPSTADVMF